MGMLRSLAIAMGALLAVVLPAQMTAAFRRAGNEASGYTPNMEPGVVVALAISLVVPIVAVVLLIELIRSWGLGQKPLSLASCAALGAMAACPVGYTFSPNAVQLSYPVLLFAGSIGVLALYGIRWVWLARSTRGPATTRA